MGSSSSRAPKTAMEEVAERVEKRVGKIPLSGRFHRAPENFEDTYVVTKTVLGTGCNGNVMMANGRGAHSDRKFAVKAFELMNVAPSEKSELESEVEIFLTIDHPHIARLIDVYEDDRHLHLIMECLEGGELFDRLTEKKKFNEQDAAEAAYQMLLAVNYLHTLGFVHRDLNLENFLYDVKGSNHLKLIDFGFSKIWDPNIKMHMSCGTLSYVAPEVLEKSYTSQCDLWSLGVIVFILLVGYMPFSGKKDDQRAAIMQGRFTMKPDRWKHVSAIGRGFMESLLKVSPAERLNAQQAMDHPWIAQRHGNRDSASIEGEEGDVIVNSLREFGKASKFRRACLSMMAWSLTNEERAKVREYFLEIDKSREGTITLQELQQVLTDKFEIQDAEVQQIFESMDSNKDERIHYSDFLAAMVSTRILLHEDMIRGAFERFDADNSGYITADNLRKMLGEQYEGAQVEQLIHEADFKHDGRISYAEFVHYLKGNEVSEAHQDAATKVIDGEVQRNVSENGVKRASLVPR